jgi:drug/metabolite transporter (DMT)-like permease
MEDVRLPPGSLRRRASFFFEMFMITRPMTLTTATPTAAPQGQSAPSPLRGILLIMASTGFFAVSDVITKQLTAALPAGEVAWMRYAVFVLLVLPTVALNGGGTVLRSHRPGLQILRGLGMVGSTIAFTHGLRFLPVADATAINFVSPILIMALSVLLLHEAVGWRRWSAAAAGFLGVMIVMRPGTGAFHAAAFLPLLAAASWAGAAIVTRRMSGSDHPLTTLAYSAIVGFLVLSAALPSGWVTPGWTEIALGLGIGVLSTIAHWLVILAYRHGDASVLAPFSYTQLIAAGVLGYLVFGTLPDGWTILGACIIAASGLYTAYRARIRALEKASA